jgi:hypothetical protein
VLAEVGELVGIGTIIQDDQFHHFLESDEDLVKCTSIHCLEAFDHHFNKIINGSLSLLLLERLDGIKETKVKHIQIWTVGRLLDQLHLDRQG